MGTDLDPVLYPINSESAATRQRLSEFSKVIAKITKFGCRIFEWCNDANSTASMDAPPMMMFRNILELLDAISILMKYGSADPCRSLMRTILETHFYLAYILDEDTTNRSNAFLVCHYRNLKKELEMHDPATKRGERIGKLTERDAMFGRSRSLKGADHSKLISEIDKILEQDEFRIGNQEYRMQARRKRTSPRWYSLFNGPDNLYQLANKVHYPAIYEMLYGQLSNVVHGTDVITGRTTRNSDGTESVYQIRLPRDIQTVATMTLVLALRIHRLMINHYAQDRKREFLSWYKDDLREDLKRLSETSLFDIK